MDLVFPSNSSDPVLGEEQCHVGFARPSQLKLHDAMSMPGVFQSQTGLNFYILEDTKP